MRPIAHAAIVVDRAGLAREAIAVLLFACRFGGVGLVIVLGLVFCV